MFKRLSNLNISLSPEAPLLRAVSQFESALSDQAKIEFRKLKLYTRANLPSDHDVYRLTIELDRMIAADGLHKRAYGPRLISLLQCVQQFATLREIEGYDGDMFTTCDSWAVIEFCLHVGEKVGKKTSS